jgi:hypothetical protein
MTIQMHMLMVMYTPLDQLNFTVSVPYLVKDMDMFPRDGHRFTEHSDGFGDVELLGTYTVCRAGVHQPSKRWPRLTNRFHRYQHERFSVGVHHAAWQRHGFVATGFHLSRPGDAMGVGDQLQLYRRGRHKPKQLPIWEYLLGHRVGCAPAHQLGQRLNRRHR